MTTEYQSEAEHAMATRLQELTALKDERLATLASLRATEKQLVTRLSRIRSTVKTAKVTAKKRQNPTPSNAEIDQTLVWCRKYYPDDVEEGPRRLSNLAAANPYMTTERTTNA